MKQYQSASLLTFLLFLLHGAVAVAAQQQEDEQRFSISDPVTFALEEAQEQDELEEEEPRTNLRQLQVTCAGRNYRRCKKVKGSCNWNKNKKKCVKKKPSCFSQKKKWKCKKLSYCRWNSKKKTCLKRKTTSPTPAPPTQAPPTQAPPTGGTTGKQAALAAAVANSCPTSGAAALSCQVWLEAHNSRRYDWHTAKGKTPSLLEWDDRVAAKAQKFADELAATCSFSHSQYTLDGERLGENLAYNTGTKYPDDQVAEAVMLRWWNKEIQYARDGLYKGSNPKPIGHFTQAAWYVSTKLGCATSVASCGRKYQVCHYKTFGNCNVGDWSDWRKFTVANPDPCSRSI